MMFVIIIIAVLSLYFANFIQQRTNAQTAAETAGQIMQWLQASQNYYMQNLYWPQSTNGDGGWSVLYNGGFLPATEQCSKLIQGSSSTTTSCGLFGTFTVGYASGNDPNGQPFTYKTSKYITISTPVANAALGQQIAANLPNGQYANGQVMGYANTPNVVPPGQYKLMIRGQVVAPTLQDNKSSNNQYYQLYGSTANGGTQPVTWQLNDYGQGGSELDIIFTNAGIPNAVHKQEYTGVTCAYYGAYQYSPGDGGDPFAGNTAECKPCVPSVTSPHCSIPLLTNSQRASATSATFYYNAPSFCSAGNLGSGTLGIQTGSNPKTPAAPSSGTWPPATGIAGPTFVNVKNETTGLHAANLNVQIVAHTNCLFLGGNNNVQTMDGLNPFINPSPYQSLLSGNTILTIQPGESLADHLTTLPWWGATNFSGLLTGLNIYAAQDTNPGGPDTSCSATITLTWMDPINVICYQAQARYALSSTSIWANNTSVNSGTGNIGAYCQAQLIQTQLPTKVKCQ